MIVRSVITYLAAVCLITACGGSGGGGGGGGGGGNCERVTDKATGYGDVEIRNDLGTGVLAYFPELVFEALIRPDKCELFGVPSGTRSLEFTQCNFQSDDDCIAFGAAVNIAVLVEPDATDVIQVSDLF